MKRLKTLSIILLSLFTSEIYAGKIDQSNLEKLESNFKFDKSFSLKLGGWSKHITQEGDNYDYNESHKGYGFDFNFLQTLDDVHSLSFEYFGMKDSYNKDALHVGFTYGYDPKFENKILDSVQFKLSLMYMKRTFKYLLLNNGGYSFDNYKLEERSLYVPLPHITIKPIKYFDVDLMYIPQMKEYEPEHIMFVRFGLNLTEIAKSVK